MVVGDQHMTIEQIPSRWEGVERVMGGGGVGGRGLQFEIVSGGRPH